MAEITRSNSKGVIVITGHNLMFCHQYPTEIISLGTMYPHPWGWSPNREKRRRLPASGRSGTRVVRYGQRK